MVYKGLSLLGRLIFPPCCVLCGERGTEDRDLCGACASELPYIETHCYRCGVPLADSGETAEHVYCGLCLQKPPYFDRVLSPLRYEQPIDWLVQRLKYNANLSHVRLLGGLLRDHLEQIQPAVPDMVIPVPLHANRMRERGFNQAAELARPLARFFAIPLETELCQRQIDTPTQSALTAKQRAKNLREAFSIKRRPGAKHIALVDDVVTTGATVNALARLLKQNGVEQVQIWCVARTPSGRER